MQQRRWRIAALSAAGLVVAGGIVTAALVHGGSLSASRTGRTGHSGNVAAGLPVNSTHGASGRAGGSGSTPGSAAHPGAANTTAGSGAPGSGTSGPVYYRNQVIALMYHDVQAKKLPGDVITPQTFAEELALMKQDNFHAVTLAQVENFLQGRGTIPDNAVLITFDNGYESFYTHVYPLLQQYHDPAVLFAIVRWLSPPQKKGLFQSLTWAQVEQMSKSGLVQVESQTYNLHQAAEVAPGKTSPATVARIYDPATGQTESLAAYKARVYADVKRAREDLMARLHEQNVNALCYPFGDYNPAFVQVLHQAGYKYLFTASYGWGILQNTSPDTLYRLDAGSPVFSANGLISTIRQIASLTAANPSWHAPNHYIQVWG